MELKNTTQNIFDRGKTLLKERQIDCNGVNNISDIFKKISSLKVSPQLEPPTLSISNEKLKITDNLNNGNFTNKYNLYIDGKLKYFNRTLINKDLIDIKSLGEKKIKYTINMTCCSNNMLESKFSDSIKIGYDSLIFTSENGSAFSLSSYNNKKTWDGELEYSLNGIHWETWNPEDKKPERGYLFAEKGVLYLRGINNTKITGYGEDVGFRIGITPVRCNGNIENLLDYQTVANGGHPEMAEYCFSRLFFNNYNKLIHGPELLAPTLSEYCYYQMFKLCNFLEVLPKLPATTLAFRCYSDMFANTAIKVSTIQNEKYQFAWRIPTSGTGTTAVAWNDQMLYNTDGTFTSDPSINTTYYTTNPPV